MTENNPEMSEEQERWSFVLATAFQMWAAISEMDEAERYYCFQMFNSWISNPQKYEQ